MERNKQRNETTDHISASVHKLLVGIFFVCIYMYIEIHMHVGKKRSQPGWRIPVGCRTKNSCRDRNCADKTELTHFWSSFAQSQCLENTSWCFALQAGLCPSPVSSSLLPGEPPRGAANWPHVCHSTSPPILMGCTSTHPNSPCMSFSLWCTGCLLTQTVLLPLLSPSKTSHYLGGGSTSNAERYFVHREAEGFLHLVYLEGLKS